MLLELETYRIIPRVGEPIRHADYEQNEGVASHRYTGFAFLDFDQCRPANRRSRCGNFCGNASPSPRVTYIVAELAQGAGDGNG
jgi:hypothetical protein